MNATPKLTLNNDAILTAIRAYGTPSTTYDALATALVTALRDSGIRIDADLPAPDDDNRDHGQRIIDALKAALPLITIED